MSGKLMGRKVRPRMARPKRLQILRKSKTIQQWLLRNPWVRPMCVFNFAAVKIQQHLRGFILRRRMKNGLKNGKFQAIVPAKVSKKKANNKQLDRYLTYMDKCRKGISKKPKWLDEGYSTWCAVRIQSQFRMFRVRKRHLFSKRLINQVASIIIQTAWRNRMYRVRVTDVNDMRPTVILDVFVAAEMIQLCWRQYCNKRIYRYFRDLVTKNLKGAPYELLRSVIPNESHLLDRASGVHARFRLGGRVFPPKVYFKIYTHRPLCDVNSFAPRNYVNERPPDPAQVLNRSSTIAPKANQAQAIRVGARYFGAVVSTTSTAGTSDWYKRDERNDWRPIASHMFENISTPPWYREVAHTSKPKAFHFSKLRRDEDLKKARKKRRRQWMVKAFMFATTAAAAQAEAEAKHTTTADPCGNGAEARWSVKQTPDRKESEDRSDGYSRPEYEGTPSSFRYADMKQETAGKIIASYYHQTGQKYIPGKASGLNSPMTIAESKDSSRDLPTLRSAAADFKRSFADSVDSESKSVSTASVLSRRNLVGGVGGGFQGAMMGGYARDAAPINAVVSSGNNSSAQAQLKQNYQIQQFQQQASRASSPPGKGRYKSAADSHVDLVDWSLALNFDEYARGWEHIGTSLPSDAKDCRDKEW